MFSFIHWLARAMAIIGGLVMCALIVLVGISILGRGANTFGHSDLLRDVLPGLAKWLIATGVGPVKGDFEIVEAGIAFSVFSCLPLCQFKAGHATVDLFTNMLPDGAQRALASVWEVAFAAVMVLISVQLYVGTENKFDNGETTFLLQFPIWWAYAFASISRWRSHPTKRLLRAPLRCA